MQTNEQTETRHADVTVMLITVLRPLTGVK